MDKEKLHLFTFGYGVALIVPYLMLMGAFKHQFSVLTFVFILLGTFAILLTVISQIAKLRPLFNLWIGVVQYFVFAQKLNGGVSVILAVLMALAVIIYLVTLIKVEKLSAVYKGWMKIAHVIGTVITSIILTLLFFIVFGISGIVLRIIGKDLLDRKLEPNSKSYWMKRKEISYNKESYTKQY